MKKLYWKKTLWRDETGKLFMVRGKIKKVKV